MSEETTDTQATKHTKPVALMHPDNETEKPKGYDVFRHDNGPLEGYIEAEYDEATDTYSW